MSEAATLEADAGSRKDSEAKKPQTAAARLQLSDEPGAAETQSRERPPQCLDNNAGPRAMAFLIRLQLISARVMLPFVPPLQRTPSHTPLHSPPPPPPCPRSEILFSSFRSFP